MEQALDQYGGLLFYGLLAGGFSLFVILESFVSRRELDFGLGRRWGANVGLMLIDTVLIRYLRPIGGVGVASYASGAEWGIVRLSDAPAILAIGLSILLLDLGRYLEHVALHRFKPLWRIHQVHHTDLDFDCTTGLRFHPLEAVLGLGLDTALILGFGIPPVAVALLSLVYVAETLFNHANIRLPTAADRAIRWAVVTPDMHRVHHSADRRETDTNYGVLFSWWDRLFGTYRDQPRAGHAAMMVGLEEYRDAQSVSLWRLLVMPFRAARPAPAVGATGPDAPPRPVAGLSAERATTPPASPSQSGPR